MSKEKKVLEKAIIKYLKSKGITNHTIDIKVEKIAETIISVLDESVSKIQRN